MSQDNMKNNNGGRSEENVYGEKIAPRVDALLAEPALIHDSCNFVEDIKKKKYPIDKLMLKSQ
jgi:hypothetical protein